VTLRVGLVGYGYAGCTIHAPLIAATPGLELAAVCSSAPAKVAANWPSVAIVARPAELAADPTLDLIVVATPNATHHEFAAQALGSGKHVVVDKPFTVTRAEALDLAARAATAGRVLSVFHNRRWDADFLTLRALLASGELGRIALFESHFDRYRPQVRDRWREQPEGGGGLWYDLGAHLVDQALLLFGWPAAITAHLAHQRDGARADDWFHVVLRYREPDAGLRVLLHGAALVPQSGPRFVVQGTRGGYGKFGLDCQEDRLKAGLRPRSPAPSSQSVDDFGLDPEPGRMTLYDDHGTASERTVPNLRGDYAAYYRQLRDAIDGGAEAPVTAAEALRVIDVIEAGLASDAQRREIELAREAPTAGRSH
jgi:predicted dehydrogenase